MPDAAAVEFVLPPCCRGASCAKVDELAVVVEFAAWSRACPGFMRIHAERR